MFRDSLLFKGLFLFRASFSKNDEKHVSKKININYIKLVSICSLGTVLWLTLVPAGHLCSFKGLQLKFTFVPPDTFLLSPVLQVKPQAFQLHHFCLSYFSFSELRSDSIVSALNQKSMQFLDNKSDYFHSGRVLKP